MVYSIVYRLKKLSIDYTVFLGVGEVADDCQCQVDPQLVGLAPLIARRR